jgi:drug/metabolite transporter (DMT)-like permease
MFSGGLVLLFVSLISGEMSKFNITQVSSNSWFGLVYLIIFGSLIGFTAYSWLLKNAQPAMVATYAYVNPIIAVFLGWLIASESFTTQMLIGAGVIVGSVVLITSHDKNDKNSEEEIRIHTSECQIASA